MGMRMGRGCSGKGEAVAAQVWLSPLSDNQWEIRSLLNV